jgi:predicted metal-binding membrane protein
VERLAGSPLDRGIEAALRRDRWAVAGSLTLIVALAWLYVWRDAAHMAQHLHQPSTLAMLFAMWAVMMVGMMLPSAAPAILLYATLVRKNGERGTVLPAAWTFAAAYLVVWTGFSLAAALAQTSLAHAGLLAPMMVSADRTLSGAILLAAGLYQLTPAKAACLSRCAHPLQFFTARWRAGSGGAFRMGLEHGAYCLGCCWALMLVLFVAGVMNLLWVALIAAFVLLEKLLPAGRLTSWIAGAALAAAGLYLLATAPGGP